MQTVGELLRSEREKKGLSVKDIEAAISIRVLYIDAIEEGNYDIVPGEVYLKGFIRNYANYLGLDGQKVIETYRQAQMPIVTETSIDTPTVEEPKVRKIKKKKSNYLIEAVIILLCVVGGAWWLLGSSNNTGKEPQNNLQTQTTPVSPTSPLPTQPNTLTTPVQTKPVVIMAKYIERCWTSVIADGKQIYEGTPQSGDTLTWEAQKNITLTVGNAGGVDITSNGKPLGKIGGKGEVVVKSFVAQP